MFDGVGWGEIVVLLLIGLFVFGPDRLPKAARDAGRLLRQLRQMATGVRNDIRSELGPEFDDLDIRSLHPKTFVRKHLLEDDEPLFPPYLGKGGSLPRMLFDDLGEPPSLTKDPGRGAGGTTGTGPSLSKTPSAGTANGSGPKASGVRNGSLPAQPDSAEQSPATPYDLDAT